MKLEFLNTDLSVCKYDVPVYPAMGFVFTGKTDSEFSLVCETRYVPNGWTEKESGWSVFRVAGQLDFSLVGILAPIANILADENIGKIQA